MWYLSKTILVVLFTIQKFKELTVFVSILDIPLSVLVAHVKSSKLKKIFHLLKTQRHPQGILLKDSKTSSGNIAKTHKDIFAITMSYMKSLGERIKKEDYIYIH